MVRIPQRCSVGALKNKQRASRSLAPPLCARFDAMTSRAARSCGAGRSSCREQGPRTTTDTLPLESPAPPSASPLIRRPPTPPLQTHLRLGYLLFPPPPLVIFFFLCFDHACVGLYFTPRRPEMTAAGRRV